MRATAYNLFLSVHSRVMRPQMDFRLIESHVIVNRKYKSVSGSCAGYFRSAIFLQFPSSDLYESFVDFLEGCS